MKLKSLFFILVLAGSVLRLYAQNTLQDYVEFARQNSPLIRDHMNQIIASDYEIQRLRALYTKFQIGLTGNYLFAPIVSTDHGTDLEWNSGGADHYYGYDLSQTNGGLYQGLIAVNKPLFNKKRFRAFAGQEEVNKQANENKIQLTAHDIEKSVTDQYILCLLDKKQVFYYDSISSILNGQLTIIRKLVEASVLKQSDLTLLKIEYENNQAQLATYRATYRRDLLDLYILCGLQDTTFVILPDISIPLRYPVTYSGYLEKFRIDSLSLIAAQMTFETKYLPQVSAFSNAGLNAVYAPLMLNRFGFSAGLTATWDLYDGHQRQITQTKTNIQLETIAFYEDHFNVQNAVRKNKILADLRANAERGMFLQNQLADYQNLLLAYKKEIMQGQLPIINYIIVLKNMVAVKRDYLILEANNLLLANEYNYWNW
jgi:outer membrane protein TolC